MRVIRWGTAARVGIEGVSVDEARGIADRWCGAFDPNGGGPDSDVLQLVVQGGMSESVTTERRRIRIGARGGDGIEPLEMRIGPHAVVPGDGAEPDRIRFSGRRPASPLEHELLIDLGIIHLLARQGLPMLHSCAFELDGLTVLGLGESFSGKSTVSMAVMRAGGRVVSDDVVLAIPAAGGRFSLLAVRSYGWLRGNTREIVPNELQDKMVPGTENGQPRWTLYREEAEERFVAQAVPEVIWDQSIDRRLNVSRVESVDQGQVFAALIRASSPLYLSRHCPEIRDKLIPVLRSLCAQCRGYRVRLGRRLLQDPEREMAHLMELSR